ncbi:hypothetical protein Tco_0512477 [Tanacetum coccineum]
MINRKSKYKVFSTMRILSVVSVEIEKKSGYGYLEKIVVRRADQKLYKFKEGDFLDLHLNDIEDMLLLIAQNKLFNLDDDVIVDFVTALKMLTRGIISKNRVEDVQLGVESYQRKLNLTKPQRTCQLISVKEPYTPNFDPLGFIYEDKSKKKRLMRVDEIHKFCDGNLQSVRNILPKRLLNFKFGYNKGMPSREWTIKDKRCTGIMLNKIVHLLFKRRVLRSLEVLNQRDLPRDIPLDSIEVLRTSNAYAGNPVKEILLNLNLPDHRSVLTEPEVHVKMEMEITRSSIVKPDIAFVVGKLSSFTSNSNTQHSQAVQRKQTCITSSIAKSEFVALVAAGKETEWLKNLILEISLWPKPIAHISISCDSATTLAKAYSQMYNEKSRHLGVRHRMIHELIMNGVVSIEFVRLQQDLDDHLTKALVRDLVLKSAKGTRLNVTPPNWIAAEYGFEGGTS